jgi:D-3-phosphoglycerate dehydrogenase / 2-oxoglutarate reductase
VPKILVLDNLSEEGVEVFRAAPGFEVDVKPAQKPDQLAAIIGDYDGLVVRSGTTVTPEAIAHAKKLKVIGRAGVGTDNIDKDAATAAGIVVMNTPGGNTISTCEHTFALLFALCRNVPSAHAGMQEGRWDRNKYMGAELFGKTLGIVGVGRIGGAVAKRAQAFEMKVIAFDPVLNQLKAEALGIELVSIDELIERSDFITLHAPKTEKTNNMIRAEHFPRMKPTCRMVNCARGGLVNEQDLADALRNKTIAGAALDVFTKEPPENNPFLGLDNVIMTPHLAASTDEAQVTVAVDVAKQMVDYLTTGAIVNAVNVPSLDAETRKALAPYLYLAQKLGRFEALYVKGRPSEIEITYCGETTVTDTYPITAAVLSGFLEPTSETVNLVSAPIQLKDHGIASKETRSPAESDYDFHIEVRVTTDKESVMVAGTLFGNDDPRICMIDDIRMDAVPEGWMIVCENEDKPLVLGRLTTAIGEAGVNIANMTLGRNAPHGKATTLINLDGPLPDEALEKIKKIPNINQVRQLNL